MLTVMPNTSLSIELQPAERTQLEKWESSHGTPQQVALRCRIILRAVAGQQNVAIAEELGVSRPTVLLWRKRVREQGIGEVWEIAPGRGRKPQYDQAKRDGIINATPQGMAENPESPVPDRLLGPSVWVADIVYFPMETALLERARALGCRTLDCGGMAVFQAVEAFRLFTGITPDAERMLRDFASVPAVGRRRRP